MTLTLSAFDKERVRFALGYLNVEPSASIQLGFPAAGQAEFLVERAMNRLMPETVGRVLRLLDALDTIEKQLICSLDRLKAIKLGELTLRNSTNDTTEQDLLEVEYYRWACRLADNLGVPINPYAERFRRFTGGVNITVASGV